MTGVELTRTPLRCRSQLRFKSNLIKLGVVFSLATRCYLLDYPAT